MVRLGDRIGSYVLEAKLGEGGMGAVYRALDESLHRRVAVKLVRALDGVAPEADERGSRAATARLLREARAAASLDHPNAVTIFGVGEHEGSPYIAMELVDGKTLRELMAEDAPVATKLRWLCDIARALAAAHKRGIVHRDIKPENIMVRSDGVLKVLDFGIAKRTHGEIDGSAPTEVGALGTVTTQGVAIGTPLYMSPEQLQADPLDGRTDQFSWSVVACELLIGTVPWKAANTMSIVASILSSQPANVEIPSLPEVEAVVRRGLAKTPSERFESMDALLATLEPLSLARATASGIGGSEPVSGLGPQPQESATAPPKALVREPAGASATTAHLAIQAAPIDRPARPGFTGRGILVGIMAGAILLGGALKLRDLPTSSSLAASPAPVSGSASSSASGDSPPAPPDRAAASSAPAPSAASSVPERGYGYEFSPDVVGGRIPPEAIQHAVRTKLPEMQACWEAGRKRQPALKGRITVRLVIGSKGVPTSTSLAESDIDDPAVKDCILKEFGGLTFPPPSLGDIVTIVYPIEFKH